jgi:hypothetical protein
MTKAEYIDTIRNIVDPSGKNPRFRPQQIEACLEFVYNQFTSTLPESRYSDFDFLTKEYTSQTVTLDATTNRYYTDLPAPLVPLQIPSEAVRHIGTNQAVAFDFCPITETIWGLMDGLFSHDIDTTIGYIVRYNKVWYNESMTADIVDAGVRMVLAVPFRSFDYDEDVNIPMGGIDLAQAVVQILSGTQPMNLKNDNK